MLIQDKIQKLRLSLRYKIEVNGQPDARNLPLRLVIAGYFSQVYSTELALELAECHIHPLDCSNSLTIKQAWQNLGV